MGLRSFQLTKKGTFNEGAHSTVLQTELYKKQGFH